MIKLFGLRKSLTKSKWLLKRMPQCKLTAKSSLKVGFSEATKLKEMLKHARREQRSKNEIHGLTGN